MSCQKLTSITNKVFFSQLGGSQEQVDLEPRDPFDELEETGDNTQESVAGSSHSSSHSQEVRKKIDWHEWKLNDNYFLQADNERNVNFSPNLAEVIGGAFLADIDSPIPFEAPSSDELPQESPKEADTAEGSDSTEVSNSNSDTDNTAGVSTYLIYSYLLKRPLYTSGNIFWMLGKIYKMSQKVLEFLSAH